MKMIVCTDLQYAIGNKNELLYNIKEDMIRFKEFTYNQTVVMGRKTYESLPSTLPNRIVKVLTHTITEPYHISFDSVLLLDDPIIIGGAEIYELFKNHINHIELTMVYDMKEYDTSIKWLETQLRCFSTLRDETKYLLDRTDNIKKKVRFVTFIKDI